MTDSARPARITISAEAWALMLFLALLWGGAFPATRQAVSEAGVLTVVAIRAGGGALALWLYILARGLPVRLGRRRLAAFAAMGLLNNVLPWCLLVWGQRHIEAGLAAILNASTAFFAVALAAIVFRDGDLTLVPREGAQPPMVNGEPVPAEGRSVRTGDGLEVAGTRLEVLAPE